MQPIAVAHAMHQLPHHHLRLGVLGSHQSHTFGTLLSSQCVHYEVSIHLSNHFDERSANGCRGLARQKPVQRPTKIHQAIAQLPTSSASFSFPSRLFAAKPDFHFLRPLHQIRLASVAPVPQLKTIQSNYTALGGADEILGSPQPLRHLHLGQRRSFTKITQQTGASGYQFGWRDLLDSDFQASVTQEWFGLRPADRGDPRNSFQGQRRPPTSAILCNMRGSIRASPSEARSTPIVRCVRLVACLAMPAEHRPERAIHNPQWLPVCSRIRVINFRSAGMINFPPAPTHEGGYLDPCRHFANSEA